VRKYQPKFISRRSFLKALLSAGAGTLLAAYTPPEDTYFPLPTQEVTKPKVDTEQPTTEPTKGKIRATKTPIRSTRTPGSSEPAAASPQTPENNGGRLIETDPSGFAGCLARGFLQRGDTLLLRTGIYSGDFISSSNGTLDAPIEIRPIEGEKPVIDGSIDINGDYTYIKGIEVLRSGFTQRVSREAGSYPLDIRVKPGIKISAVGDKIIGCVVHDCPTGILLSNHPAMEVSGCIVYYNGWLGPDRGHGHGIYAYSPNAWIENNVFMGGYSYNIHCYAANPEKQSLDVFYVRNNISFIAGELGKYRAPDILIGGSAGMVTHSPTLYGNCTYGGASVVIGYQGTATDIILVDNYFPEGIITNGNIFLSEGNTLTRQPDLRVFLRPAFENRLHLAVYNEAQSESVPVDLASVTGLAAGDRVRVHNIQDYDNDRQDMILDDRKSITIDMRASQRTVVSPNGSGWSTPVSRFPKFGAFMLEKI
jgi:hypothetical protein